MNRDHSNHHIYRAPDGDVIGVDRKGNTPFAVFTKVANPDEVRKFWHLTSENWHLIGMHSRRDLAEKKAAEWRSNGWPCEIVEEITDWHDA